MPEQQLLDDAAEAVYKKLDDVGGDPQRLDPVLQPVAILYTVQAIVDNGGFRYLFENNLPFSPPYSVLSDAYRQIGAAEVADKLDSAVALFPFENPHTNEVARNEFMDSLDESDQLFVLGDQVCGDERVWELMEQYVRDHPQPFAA